MNKGCKHYVGEIIKRLQIIQTPYKRDGNKNYYAMVQCLFCGKQYETNLSEIKRHVFDGCGCQKSRCHSSKWQSLATWCKANNTSKLIDLWDYDKNATTPNDISSCTQQKFYFKCDCQIHESELHSVLTLTRLANRVRPICTKCKSVAQGLINKYGSNALDIYWDYTQNKQNPWQIQLNTHEMVWIKCTNRNHPSRFRRIGDFISKNVDCPWCVNETTQSKYQKAVTKYLKDKYNCFVYHEYECTIYAINPVTQRKLPFDNEIIFNNQHLIIEVQGEQHYKPNWLTGEIISNISLTKYPAFEQQKYRDLIKKQYVNSLHNYWFLAIPYWMFRDDSFKPLIDTKIQEILNSSPN